MWVHSRLSRVNQNVIGLSGGQTLVLTFGLNIENTVTLPQPEALSDHCLISFIIVVI